MSAKPRPLSSLTKIALVEMIGHLMQYEEIQPSPALASYLKCFWFLESTLAESAGQERILPDGCTEIVFNLAQPFQQHNPDGTIERQPHALVVGQMRRHLLIEPTGLIRIMGLRFWPGGIYPFLLLPQDEIADKVIDLDSIWGRRSGDIQSRIGEAQTNAQRVWEVEKILLSCLSRRPEDYHHLTRAVSLILLTGGRLSINYLTHQMGISLRTLDRRFNTIVGLPPKVLCRIARFQRALKMLEQKENQVVNWVQIALECGFYDQPHFIKEFRTFSGREPTSYSIEAHSMSDHFTRTESVSFSYNTELRSFG